MSWRATWEAVRVELERRHGGPLSGLNDAGWTSRPISSPLREDKRESFTLKPPTTDDPAGRWHDQATGDGGAIRDLAERLGVADHRPPKPAPPADGDLIAPVPDDAPEPPTKIPRGGPVAARWAYRDADGRLLFYVCRADTGKGKEIRPCTLRRMGDRVTWAWKSYPKPRPIYRLDELANRPDARVLLVEGEKTADAAAGLFADHVCTTTSGGAAAAASADLAPLQGRAVVIWPDHDDAGRKYAETVAHLAAAAGAESVRVVEVPEEFPEKWDLADTPPAGAGLRRLLEGAGKATPPPPDDGKRQPSQASLLVDIIGERYRLALGDSGEPFAVPHDGPSVARLFRGSGSLRQETAAEFAARHGRVPSSSALVDALAVAEGRALAAPREALGLRIVADGDRTVIDLGRPDGLAVILEPGSWSLASLPVLVRRTALTGEMPEPVRGGDLGTLRDLVNIAPGSWPLLVGYMVAALIPGIPHPVLAFMGEQGTGKSTAARLVTSVLDPSPAPLRMSPKDPEGWAIAAAGSWVVGLDNVSSIPAWLSDALCRASTGEGLVRRMLYSDDALTVTSFRRVVVLTAIDAGALRGDLADRLLLTELDTIDPADRRTDREIAEQFRSLHPRILGGLLDLTAKVLEVLPTVRLDRKPRMADFAMVLAALDLVTGWRSLQAYIEMGDSLAEAVVESDPVASAVLKLVSQHGGWSGTAGELLDAITPADDGRRRRGWPANAHAMAARLKKCAPALRQMGVTVPSESTRQAGTGARVYHLELMSRNEDFGGVTFVTICDDPKNANVTPQQHINKRVIRGCDVCDDRSPSVARREGEREGVAEIEVQGGGESIRERVEDRSSQTSQVAVTVDSAGDKPVTISNRDRHRSSQIVTPQPLPDRWIDWPQAARRRMVLLELEDKLSRADAEARVRAEWGVA